jgi:hypothetical protein
MGSLAIFVALSLLVAATAQPAPVDSYIFDKFDLPLTPARAEAIVGSTSDYSLLFVLSGRDASGKSVNSSAYVDLTKSPLNWTYLGASFSRWGACSSQAVDDARTSIWVYGGVPDVHHNNTALGLIIGIPVDTNNVPTLTFTPIADPPVASKLSTRNVSCVAAADNSKFYVLFGDNLEDDEVLGDDAAGCSSVIAVYDPKTNWTVLNTTGQVPTARTGANTLIYGNTIVLFGGGCDNDESDVYRLDLTSNVWTKDTPTGTIPARSWASAFIQQDSLIVFGGYSRTLGVHQDAWIYDLVKKTWTMVNTTSTLPTARYQSSVVSLQNRGVIVGGQSHFDDILDDVVQVVVEQACLTRGCEECTNTDGCGYCIQNGKCVAGSLNNPFVFSSCNVTTQYITDLDSCPQIFPSYGIALLVIGGVVVVGIIIFAIMKVRGGADDKEGYERIR